MQLVGEEPENKAERVPLTFKGPIHKVEHGTHIVECFQNISLLIRDIQGFMIIYKVDSLISFVMATLLSQSCNGIKS